MVELSGRQKEVARFVKLFEKRKQILAMPPEKALNAILDSPQPAALMHSFPEEDFYFLIHEIGIEDSLALLSLASNKQWEYTLDIEVWERDRIEIHSVTKWLDLLFKVDPERFIRWFLKEKTSFMELYFFKNIEVKIRENDQDPSEFGQEYFTFDDTIYVRFRKNVFDPDPEEPASDQTIQEHRNAFISNFFKQLAGFDFGTYRKVLLETSAVLPAEIEEEAYRRRNFRLAEKGFVPFDEAVGVYQPLKQKDFESLSVKSVSADTGRQILLPIPLYSAGMLKDKNLFTEALKRIGVEEVLHQIQTEFAGLCNQVGVADQKIIREKQALEGIVKKVCGYINVGLEHLTVKDNAVDVSKAAELVQTYPLAGIFRVGYGLALDLKRRADKWRKSSWFEENGLRLSFWGEQWMGVLGGLLIKKPMFYDNYETGVLYREFASMADIKKTQTALDQIIVTDKLLSHMDIRVVPVSPTVLTFKNLLLTVWARHYLNLSPVPAPLGFDDFTRFFDDLWTGKDRPRKTSQAMKTSFLNWLADQSKLADYNISQNLAQTLEDLFSEIEIELGDVARKDLDPRFIQLFIIELPSERIPRR